MRRCQNEKLAVAHNIISVNFTGCAPKEDGRLFLLEIFEIVSRATKSFKKHELFLFLKVDVSKQARKTEGLGSIVGSLCGGENFHVPLELVGVVINLGLTNVARPKRGPDSK